MEKVSDSQVILKGATEVNTENFPEDNLPPEICNEVFAAFAFFFNCDNIDIRRQTLIALGHFCVQNYEFLSKSELKDVYIYLLSQSGVQTDIKIQVLRNILMYLTEEEQIMVRRDKDCKCESRGFVWRDLILNFRANASKNWRLERNGRRVIRYGECDHPNISKGNSKLFLASRISCEILGHEGHWDCVATRSDTSHQNCAVFDLSQHGSRKGGKSSVYFKNSLIFSFAE